MWSPWPRGTTQNRKPSSIIHPFIWPLIHLTVHNVISHWGQLVFIVTPTGCWLLNPQFLNLIKFDKANRNAIDWRKPGNHSKLVSFYSKATLFILIYYSGLHADKQGHSPEQFWKRLASWPQHNLGVCKLQNRRTLKRLWTGWIELAIFHLLQHIPGITMHVYTC